MASELIKRAHEVGFHRAALEHGATITDGPLPYGIEKSWGHAAFSGGKMIAHYYTRQPPLGEDGFAYRAECGHFALSVPRVPLLSAGNLPYCQRCERKLMKAGL